MEKTPNSRLNLSSSSNKEDRIGRLVLFIDVLPVNLLRCGTVEVPVSGYLKG